MFSMATTRKSCGLLKRPPTTDTVTTAARYNYFDGRPSATRRAAVVPARFRTAATASTSRLLATTTFCSLRNDGHHQHDDGVFGKVLRHRSLGILQRLMRVQSSDHNKRQHIDNPAPLVIDDTATDCGGGSLPEQHQDDDDADKNEEEPPITNNVCYYALVPGSQFHGDIRLSSGKTGLYPIAFNKCVCYAEVELHPSGHLPEEREEFSLRDFLKFGQLVLGQRPSAWDRYRSKPYVCLGDSPEVRALVGSKVNITVTTGEALVVEDRTRSCRRAVLPVDVHLVDDDGATSERLECPSRDGADGCHIIIGRETVLFEKQGDSQHAEAVV